MPLPTSVPTTLVPPVMSGFHHTARVAVGAECALVPAVNAFLDTIRDGHPTVPIVVATPIICPAVEDRPRPTRTDERNQVYAVERTLDDSPGALSLSRIRELVGLVVTTRREQGMTGCSW